MSEKEQGAEQGAPEQPVGSQGPGVLALKPGFMVFLRTEVRGGVTRRTKDIALCMKVIQLPIGSGQVYCRCRLADGHEGTCSPIAREAEVHRYEAEVTITDKDEHECAERVRQNCRRQIEVLCETTPFGLLCAPDREGELVAAIRQSRQDAEAHNATATHTFVEVWALRGYIAASDAESIKAFQKEMRAILDEMNAGIAGADADKIRDAVKRAKVLQQMIDGEHAAQVRVAIAQAREMANAIARAARERGDEAEAIVVATKNDEILAARAMFLEVDEGAPVEEAVPVASARALDVDDGDAVGTVVPVAAPSPMVDDAPGAGDEGGGESMAASAS